MMNFIKRQMRKRSQVYILPTRMGGYFLGLISVLFMLSLFYSSNLLLLFNLVIFSLLLMWLVESHFQLKKNKMISAQVNSFFQDEKGFLSLELSAVLSEKNISLFFDDREILVSRDGFFEISRRGSYGTTHIKISSVYFGLFQTWIYYPLHLSFYVYPSRERSVRLEWSELALDQQIESETMISSRSKFGDSFDTLEHWGGEPLQRIKWSVFAKSEELVVGKSFLEDERILAFDLSSRSDVAKEQLVSSLTADIWSFYQANHPFLVRVNGKIFEFKQQDSVLFERCLEELSVC